MTFASNESGRPEVYVAPFPDAIVRTRVSSGGGQVARWTRHGREIVFLSTDRHLVSVPVRTAPPLQLGEPTALLTLKDETEWVGFDVSPDGQRFLVTVPEAIASEQPYNVIVNWRGEQDRAQ